MDYGFYERRKTKKDLKLKRKFRVYKKGGNLRGVELNKESNNN